MLESDLDCNASPPPTLLTNPFPSVVEHLSRAFPGVFVGGVLQGSHHKLRDILEAVMQQATSMALADSLGVTMRVSSALRWAAGLRLLLFCLVATVVPNTVLKPMLITQTHSFFTVLVNVRVVVVPLSFHLSCPEVYLTMFLRAGCQFAEYGAGACLTQGAALALWPIVSRRVALVVHILRVAQGEGLLQPGALQAAVESIDVQQFQEPSAMECDDGRVADANSMVIASVVVDVLSQVRIACDQLAPFDPKSSLSCY